jgi:hypothetical protein
VCRTRSRPTSAFRRSCWPSAVAPAASLSIDLPLEHIIDLILGVKAQTYSFEAANVRHEHEWRVWQKAKLSAGKMLMPGVVNHATDLVEHPALVADRILGYAAIVGRENVVAGTDCGPRRPGPCRPCVGQAADACRRRPPCVDVPLALVKHARGRHQLRLSRLFCSVAGYVAYSLPSRSWIRPARRWRCTTTPIWFGRSLGHAR